MSDELWKARYAVKRAVLDVVANDYRVDDPDPAHADYPDDRLDEALKEYAEAYLRDGLRRDVEEMKKRLQEEKEFRKPVILINPKYDAEAAKSMLMYLYNKEN